ncbi:MAG TPA: glycosyltransferase 87 family protein [Solirubrobacteraceae bacterium]|nr:glycosyltransferase 87 family protein [Solirubrobacteraceae bacterium]
MAGRIALSSIVAGAFLLVVFSTGRASQLVPRSTFAFPDWEAGPLHFLFGQPTLGYTGMNDALSVFLIAMLLAYGAAMLAVRSLSMRAIAVAVVAVHVILLLQPPAQLNDVFNYLGYARLGIVHHINPYAHAIRSEVYDPVYDFTTWRNLRSPYGPLFTAITYPIAMLPLPVAYWVLKTVMVLASLGFIAIVWKTATLLNRDPRFAVLFVAANPIYLFYAVGGFHNDFFMLVPSTAAIMLLLMRRDRAAGAAVMIAVAVKFTAVLLLPFLLIGAVPPQRRLRVIAGAAIGALVLAAMSLVIFGLHIPDVKDQSSILTPFSFPNLVGLLAGAGGGSPTILRLAVVLLIPVVVYFLRRRGDWITGVGWSTIALICSLSWVMPWYVVWVLPLAALGKSVMLRRAAIVMTVFLLLTFLPVTGVYLSKHGIKLLGSPVGQASQHLQAKLAGS